MVQVGSDRAGRAQHVRTYPCSFVGAYLAAKQPRHEVRVSTWLGEAGIGNTIIFATFYVTLCALNCFQQRRPASSCKGTHIDIMWQDHFKGPRILASLVLASFEK